MLDIGTKAPEFSLPDQNGMVHNLSDYPKSRLAGKVFAGGVNDAGAIKGHKALQEAYVMGRGIL